MKTGCEPRRFPYEGSNEKAAFLCMLLSIEQTGKLPKQTYTKRIMADGDKEAPSFLKETAGVLFRSTEKKEAG